MAPRFPPSEIDRIKSDVKVSDVVGGYVTWDRKKSRPTRGDYWACCPFHGDKSPSFHVDDRRGTFHCFGCGAGGDVIRFVMDKTGKSFAEAVESLGARPEDLRETPEERRKREEAHRRKVEADARRDARKKLSVREIAYRIWKEGRPIAGTLAEGYLRGRGIDFDVTLFASLRFHPDLELRDGGTFVGRWPALLAAVQAPDDGRFLGIWRIYLDPDLRPQFKGRAEVPEGLSTKVGLGAYTDAGGCVRLGRPGPVGNVVEGLETGLGVFGILGGREPVQCALSTSGMVNFRPPAGQTRTLVWPDGDVDRIRVVGGREKQIESPGIKAGRTLIERLRAEGHAAELQPTPKNARDYLDVYRKMRKVVDEQVTP